MTNEVNIILCIPGRWKDRTEIVTSLALTNMKEYIFAGKILLHIPTNKSFEIDICDADSRMMNSFKVAGQERLSDSELDIINQHTFVVYIIGKGGNQENANAIMRAGQAFLNAGGDGIKVETSGKAFSKDQWIEIINDQDDRKYFDAFVVLLLSETDSVYSCGLHNIGLRDIEIDPNIETDQAVELTKTFIYYLLFDKPTIASGQTFSVEEKAPRFKIIEEKCEIYNQDDLFFNPNGMYHLLS